MKLVYYSSEQSGMVNELKAANIQKIMHLFLSTGSMTKLDIVLKSGLSMSTVSDCINRLLRLQILQICGSEQSTGGRKPCIYRISRDYGNVLGILLERDEILASVVTADGERIWHDRFEVQKGKHYPVLLQIIDSVSEQLKRQHGGEDKLLCMGISMLNVTLNQDGVIGDGPYYGWKNVHLKELLERRYSVFTQVGNAANAAAVYQHLIGTVGNAESFLVLLKQCDGKAGIVVDGKLMHGTGDRCGRLRSPEEALSLLDILDLKIMVTDFDFSGDARCVPPKGDYEDLACAAAVNAEVNWFGRIYDMMGE